MPQIEISYDYVIIESTRVLRPDRISRSDWMTYWEKFTTPSG